MFAGLLTKVGVYAIIRAHSLLFPSGGLDPMLLVAALLTMLVGILGAIAQSDIKRLLSFTLVSHIGYMVFGIALSSQLGMSGAIYYVAHHIVVQTTLFLVVGLIERQAGASTLQRLGGLAAASPLLAFVFVVPRSISVAFRFPGFIGKVALLEAGAQDGSVLAWMLVAGGVLTSLLTLYVVVRVWTKAFWRSRVDAPEGDLSAATPRRCSTRPRTSRSPIAPTSDGCRSGCWPRRGAHRSGPDADGAGRPDLRLQRPRRHRGARPQQLHLRGAGRHAMRRYALRVWLLCWLILVWILLWGNVSVANIVSGLAIALVITVLLPLPLVPIEGRVHLLSLLRLIAQVAYLPGAVLGAGGVAGGQAGTAAVQRGAAGPVGGQVGSGAGAGGQHHHLIPGSIVLEIDQSRRLLYMHVIDVGSDRSVDRFYRQVAEIERLLVASFERDTDWRPAAKEDAT